MLEKYIENLDLFYNATKIPFCVFDTTPKDIYRCPHIKSMECSKITLKDFCERLKQMPLDRHQPVFGYSEFCFWAILRLEQDMNIIFGPVVSVPMTYKEFYEYNKDIIIGEDLLHLYKISQRSPLMPFSRFMNNILMFLKMTFNIKINNEDILSNQIDFCVNSKNDIDKLLSDNMERLVEKGILFQKTILYNMKRGNSNAIKKEFDETDYFNDLSTAVITIDELRNIFFGYIVICCVFSMKEEIETKKAILIYDTYLSKGLLIKNVNDLKALCRNVSVDYSNEFENLKEISSGSPVVKECIYYIHNHINSKISVNELAQHCGVSARTVSRHFEEFYDVSVAKYILQIKLGEAAFLLSNTKMSLSEISNQFAFSSQSHFNTAFKKFYSCTPQQYRDKNNRQIKSKKEVQ